MSAPIRFLALVVAGWGAVRAVTLGMVPGFTVSYAHDLAAASILPPPATQCPPLPPVQAVAPQWWTPQLAAYAAPAAVPPAPYYGYGYAPAYFAPSSAAAPIRTG